MNRQGVSLRPRVSRADEVIMTRISCEAVTVRCTSTQRRTWNLVLFLLLIAGTAAAEDRIPNPDSLDLGRDVSTLDMVRVRQLRGAVLARHCRHLDDPYARSDFRDYQWRTCGRDFAESYGESAEGTVSLSAAEEAFLQRLNERERELRTGRMRSVDGRTVFDPAAIVNREQFMNLPDSVFARLLRDGSVAVAGKSQQLFHVYEENEYSMLPSFITTDLMLQVYHLYFDYTLRTVERDHLLPAIQALSSGMAARLRERLASRAGDILPSGRGDQGEPQPVSNGAGTPPPRLGAYERAILYFAVAEGLCVSDSVWTPPGWVDAFRQPLLAKQAELIYSATEPVWKGPIMGTVDYTMFRVRGHYTRGPELTCLFRAMMWLGLPGFILDDRVMPMESALVVVFELTHDPELQRLYDTIYEPTAFYVGPTDDITPALARAVADSLCGPEATLDDWIVRKEAIRKALDARNRARIRTKYGDDRDLAQVRFMGARYIPDSRMFQELTDQRDRPIPTGLDIFGVLQVPLALDLQHAASIQWDQYWPRLRALQEEFRELPPAGDTDNLYWKWLHLLRTLNAPAPAAAPYFLTTRAWEAKNLNTGLASWAELRHDTILYAKQSGGAECGGGEPPPRLVGYVEPRPDVFAEMRELTTLTRTALEQRGLLSARHGQIGVRIEEMLVFLQEASRKELAGEGLSEAELGQIRIFGAEVENLTTELLIDRSASWYELTGPDRRLAVVADVHTASGMPGAEKSTGRVLEEGVGDADELFVLVDIEGDLYITRGAIFSYYEFLQPIQGRLTDEEWQVRLDAGNAPPRPEWTREFLVPWPMPILLHRYHYSSGC